MPAPANCTASGAALRLLGVWLIAALFAAPGCRVFRSHKASDESIAEARRMSLQGIDAQQRGQWDRAETLFAAAILRCPADERARAGYAESLWQRGANAQALEHMEQAVRLSGNDPERLARLGEMVYTQGDLARAGRLADVAIAANGQLAAAWALRGQVLQGRGDATGALTSYHRALSYDPKLPEIQLAVAQIYAEQNRPQRALATLQSLSESYAPGPVPPAVLIQEGLALRGLGRHQDAAAKLSQAAQTGEPNVELLCELSRTQLFAGDFSAARATLGAALTRSPGHPLCAALARDLNAAESKVITASAVGP